MESDSVPPRAVYEYVEEYPPSVPHENANDDVHYVRTLPQTMDKLRKVVWGYWYQSVLYPLARIISLVHQLQKHLLNLMTTI